MVKGVPTSRKVVPTHFVAAITPPSARLVIVTIPLVSHAPSATSPDDDLVVAPAVGAEEVDGGGNGRGKRKTATASDTDDSDGDDDLRCLYSTPALRVEPSPYK